MPTFEPKAGFERIHIAVQGSDVDSLEIDGPFSTDDPALIMALEANAFVKRSRGTSSNTRNESALKNQDDEDQPEVITNEPFLVQEGADEGDNN